MASTSSHQRTSLSILARIQRNESAAWAQLVDLYAPLVASWCRQRGLQVADTADVLQNVFFAVSRNLRGFQRDPSREGSFRSWLWVITRNKIRDWSRARRPDDASGGSSAFQRLADAAVVRDDEAESTSEQQLSELFERALSQVRSQFEPQTWQAFWRTVVDGVPTAVVAEQTGLTAAAIRQARSRVLRRLRQQLGDVD